MKLTFEQYEVRSPRWKSPSLRYREVKREYCCEELSEAQADSGVLLVEKNPLQLFLYFESDDGHSVSLPMRYCPFCGAKVEYEMSAKK